VLYRWRRHYGKQPVQAQQERANSVDVGMLEAKLRRMRQELEVIKHERDILKKAINIVSRSQA